MTDYEDTASDEDLLAKAKRCFKLACEAEQKQRDREKDDLRFQVPELQWNDDARRQREGSVVDGVPTPARPVLSIPKLDQPIQLVLNQQVKAHLGVKLQPLSPDADDEIAEILQGLYRSIERDSQAHGVRGWAFDRAVKAGRGFYLVTTEYDDAGGHPFDQVVLVPDALDTDDLIERVAAGIVVSSASGTRTPSTSTPRRRKPTTAMRSGVFW